MVAVADIPEPWEAGGTETHGCSMPALVSFLTCLSSATSRDRTLLSGDLCSKPASHSYTPVLTSSQSARSSQQSTSTWPVLFSQESPGKAAQEAGATQMAQLLSLAAQHRDRGWWLLAVRALPGRQTAPPGPSKQQPQAARLPSHLRLLQGKREHLEGFAQGRTGRSIGDTLVRPV